MKISKTPVLDVATKAARQGVATSRFRITREQAAELRRIEADQGQEGGSRYVLKLLAAKRIS
jgi:hypothetical protein